MLIHQEFRTKNDKNGNPRRLIVVYETTMDRSTADQVIVYKTSYGDPTPEHRRKMGVRLPDVQIEIKTYLMMIKRAKAHDIFFELA